MIKKFFLTLSDLLYPRHCVGCQQALREQEFLCANCCSKINPLALPCCQICSYPLVDYERVCSNCRDRKIHFVAAVSTVRYQGLMRDLLARYKYSRDQSLKPLLQKLIVRAFEDKRLQDVNFAAVVPVPLHPLRNRERGFNQVLPLAQAVAQFKKLPLQLLLKRILPTSFQANSDRQKRLKNLEGAFSLCHPVSLSGNYLLVDDVLTTGATLDECSKVLLKAGAAQVWAVILAR